MVKRGMVLAALAVVLLAVTAAPAEANNRGGKAVASEAALSVEPLPGVASLNGGSPVEVSGDDFRSNRDVLLYINCGTNTIVTADRSGSFSFQQEFYGSGDCLLRAFQYHANRWHEVATYVYSNGD